MREELVVFVRIGLYALAGRLPAGGWLPTDVADMLAAPGVAEAAVGLGVGAITFAWYWFSRARAALKKVIP